MINGEPSREAAALAAVAETEAFAPFGTPLVGADRGRWLVDRVVRGVDRARDLVPRTVPGGLGHASDQAVVLWSLHTSAGIGLPDLADAQDGLIDPPLDGQDVQQKIEGRMWLTARPTSRAAAGIALLFREVQAALRSGGSTTLDTGDSAADPAAEAFFAYEWRRLERTGGETDRQVLTLLSMLAPAPVPLSLFEEAWGPLPSPLRQAAGGIAGLGSAVRRLIDRGLVQSPAASAIMLPPAIHPLPAARLPPAERRRWLDVALRFLRAGLPADTHFHEAWPQWQAAEPHVVHIAAAAEDHRVDLAEVADLLDRLSVYYRARNYGPRAVSTAQHAIRVFEALGAPDHSSYATYLGNLALAYRAQEELPQALDFMERSVAICRESLGSDHIEYAESLNNLADMLAAAGRITEADRAFEEALVVSRRAASGGHLDQAGYVLREVLNDYASHLVRREAPRGNRDGGARRALALLDEAVTVGDRDGYGFDQIQLNRAAALRQLGDRAAARDILTALVERYDASGPDQPTLLLFGALADLAEVLAELGDPAHAEILRRAHEVDDALLAESLDPP